MRDYILSAPDEATLQAVLPEHHEEGAWDSCVIAGATIWERRPEPVEEGEAPDPGERREGFHAVLRANQLPEAAQQYLVTETVDIEPVFAGGLLTEPRPDLAEAKRRKRRRVDDERDYRIAQGFIWQSIPIDTRDTRDFDNIAGLSQMAMLLAQQGETGPVMAFRAADDETYMLTPQQVIELGAATFQHKSSHYVAAWDIKDLVEAAPDHAALEAIDIEQGWP